MGEFIGMPHHSVVYQAKKPSFGFGGLLSAEDPVFPNDYEPVAVVHTTNLERVFALTNSIDSPWHENAGIVVIKKARSTSVGDLVLQGNKLFVCMPMGWKHIADYAQANIKIPGDLYNLSEAK